LALEVHAACQGSFTGLREHDVKYFSLLIHMEFAGPWFLPTHGATLDRQFDEVEFHGLDRPLSLDIDDHGSQEKGSLEVHFQP
jgi:hypothetical protein